MNFEKLKIKAMLFVIVGMAGLQAQVVVPSTGGNAIGSGGFVNYSVGQVVYTSNIGTNGSVVPGVQQPFEISTVTGLNDVTGRSMICTAYPNPATNVVQLKVDDSINITIQSMRYQLIDMQGKLIKTQKIDMYLTEIVMSSLIPATYFLRITLGNKEIKAFKITKN
ncbi:MAG: T9SS type A sorting domain-containing protein [Sulfuricurvum sp.]|nr:T9SS type A sorting domain-containing protein [Sulfuricurvum sp.]